ncbi:NAD(P)/FAD-dependent oxidoreductase [Tsukamurella sp. 1534]|uniref:NAD(P)/FAD-dependent oxidoreductase n=1 Tax=Tsukamurella sp. 1534 TaxID=1151061 RepID=UPI000318B61D|nr:FAD-dependent oxidoreductase [Tsukamurella sp. 1534]
MATIVIVGASLAGAKTAEALRDQGYDGDLVLIGAEEHRPYERPPLSKGYLQGSDDRSSVFVHDEGWYADHSVDLRTGVRATRIDRDARTVELDDGTSVGYDQVVLATGSRPREFPDARGALYLRTLDDSDRLREAIGGGGRLGIVGAGWIGLEAAAAARQAGMDVTVVEPAPQPLIGALGPEVGALFADLHRAHGVDLRTGTKVESVLPDGAGLTLEGGEIVSTAAVLVGIGAIPNIELAKEAGLDIEGGGVAVDAGLRTSDPAVFAVGDIAAAWHPVLDRRVRVEHWATALNQPAVAAANLLGGSQQYDRLPYFFSDQYDLGMEYVGLADDYDSVVLRGSAESGEYVAFWLASDGRVLAAMNANVWDVGDAVRELIGSGRPVDAARLADTAVPLSEV